MSIIVQDSASPASLCLSASGFRYCEDLSVSAAVKIPLRDVVDFLHQSDAAAANPTGFFGGPSFVRRLSLCAACVDAGPLALITALREVCTFFKVFKRALRCWRSDRCGILFETGGKRMPQTNHSLEKRTSPSHKFHFLHPKRNL